MGTGRRRSQHCFPIRRAGETSLIVSPVCLFRWDLLRMSGSNLSTMLHLQRITRLIVGARETIMSLMVSTDLEPIRNLYCNRDVSSEEA